MAARKRPRLACFALRAPYPAIIGGMTTGHRSGGTSWIAQRLASASPPRLPRSRSRLPDVRPRITRRRARRRVKPSSPTKPCTASAATAPPPTFTPSSLARANHRPPLQWRRPTLNPSRRNQSRRCSQPQQRHARRVRAMPHLRWQRTGHRRLYPNSRLRCRLRKNLLPHRLRKSRTFPSPTASPPRGRPPISTPRCLGAATANNRLRAALNA